ncbi:MAG: restriction endonuclease subunit S [Bacteroidales bacterium]|nr:restriction endonuclease subunit S [Bacteroidales bacterium]
MGTSPAGEFCGAEIIGIPLLNGPAEFTDFYPVPVQFTSAPKRLSKPGDILFCVRGSTTGRMNWSDQEYAIGRGLAAISHKSGSEYNHFLRYLLENNLNSLLNNTNGSTFPNLTRDLLAGFIFTIPDLGGQKKISALFKSVDTKIELNNRINAELEAMAKTLYDYWFVQFDFPDTNGKPYKTSGGKMVYNPTLKREIPKGWEVSTLARWIKSDKTGDWGKESPEGNYTLQVDCIRGADINGINGNGKINTPNRFILQKNEHKLLEPFDLVIEISGGSPTQSTGRMAFITDDVLERFSHPIICSNFCKAISLHDNDLLYCFTYLWDSLYSNGVLFGWEGKTSGIKNLLFDAFVNKYHVPLPPKHLAKQFFEFAAPLERKKQTLLKENVKLESLRDWLLPMLMNGQVTVK